MRTVLRAARFALQAGQLALLAVSLYHSAVLLLSWAAPPRKRALPEPFPRFAAIVCARNEEAVIGRLIGDLFAQDVPAGHLQVIAVAHNCTDGTAAAARAAGATVIELTTKAHGKAHAIAAGAQAVRPEADFAGIFDADSRVAPDFLRRLAPATAGEDCVQAETFSRSAASGPRGGFWRQARNVFYWRPREALGLGCAINGTGWFIRPALLRELQPELRTMTEDLELTVLLASAGRRVAFCSDATVTVEEPHRMNHAFRQRTRWARGHFRVIRLALPGLLRRAASGDLRAADLAIYLLLPTRLVTRAAIVLTGGAVLLRVPFALPRALALVGVLSEWVFPAVAGLRTGLVPLRREGLRLILRDVVLSLAWFPIALWALITSNVRDWRPMPRLEEESKDAVGNA
jgi:cellulose synthase/poly-beta-1,6-N-acetylglucosamine synthase-like glycosyltransferase